jgi:SPP1 gp7 family putative phage head morphogenesis protein
MPTTRGTRTISRELERQLITEYRYAWRVIEVELTALNAKVKAARLAGETINRDWLRRVARLEDIERQVVAQISQITHAAQGAITELQARAIVVAREEAETLIRKSLGPPPAGAHWFPNMPTQAFEQLVATSYRGRYLPDLLAKLGPEAGQAVRSKLSTGLLLGKHPSAIARDIRTALGGNMSRARTIARTEVLNAYRASSGATYKANRDVVEGWIWEAELDACPECAAQDGRQFPVDELLLSHPSCRCSPVPVVKSWADLGFGVVPEELAA